MFTFCSNAPSVYGLIICTGNISWWIIPMPTVATQGMALDTKQLLIDDSWCTLLFICHLDCLKRRVTYCWRHCVLLVFFFPFFWGWGQGVQRKQKKQEHPSTQPEEKTTDCKKKTEGNHTVQHISTNGFYSLLEMRWMPSKFFSIYCHRIQESGSSLTLL